MRFLWAIAIVLGLWSATAIILVDFSHAVFSPPASGISAELSQRKHERTNEFYGKGLMVSAACFGLATLIGLGKRMLTAKSMDNTIAPIDAEPSPPT